jgi:small subunit ribosomal protein S6
MIILNPDAEEERQQEMLERVQQLLQQDGGVIDHLDDWGRRKITYAMAKKADGRFVVITCSTPAAALDEVGRVMSINKDVVLRHQVIRHSRAEAEHAKTAGAPLPADDRPDREERSPRGGPRGGGGGGRGRRPSR